LSATGKCPQALGFRILGMPEKPLEARTYLLFRVGDYTEAGLKSLMIEHLEGKHWAGFVFGEKFNIPNEDKPIVIYKQKEIILNVPKFKKMGEKEEFIQVKGHYDGIGLKTWNDAYLLEIKSMNDYAFDRFCKGQIDESYIWQVQAYMQVLGLTRTLVVASAKMTSHIAEQIIERDPAYDAIKRWSLILSHTSESTLPQTLAFKEEGSTPETTVLKVGFPCSYCSYVDKCFNEVTVTFDKKSKPVIYARSVASQQEIIKKQKDFLKEEK
jgi:hypothetical protein